MRACVGVGREVVKAKTGECMAIKGGEREYVPDDLWRELLPGSVGSQRENLMPITVL